MAPSLDPSGNPELDGLLKKRQTIAATRTEENLQRTEAEKKEDDELELAKKNATRTWEAERTKRLAQNKAESLSSFTTLEARHAQELAALQKRQVAEASELKRCNTKRGARIEMEFAASYTDRETDVENRIKDAVNARERNGMDLKRKRDTEDSQLKNDVFAAFEAMALPAQNEKRQISGSNALSSAVENTGVGEGRQASKRQKVKHEAEVPIPASVSPLVEDSFRLKAIQGTLNDSSDALDSNFSGSEKYLRFNGQKRLFYPYNGAECEAESHPEWVLSMLHCRINYESSKASLILYQHPRTLRVEFWNTAELYRFIRFCDSQKLGISLRARSFAGGKWFRSSRPPKPVLERTGI